MDWIESSLYLSLARELLGPELQYSPQLVEILNRWCKKAVRYFEVSASWKVF